MGAHVVAIAVIIIHRIVIFIHLTRRTIAIRRTLNTRACARAYVVSERK
jgi:hypothetical protein